MCARMLREGRRSGARPESSVIRNAVPRYKTNPGADDSAAKRAKSEPKLFALRVFRRPDFEHRDIGVQVGWGLFGPFCDDVQDFRELGGLWAPGCRGSGVQGLGLRLFGIGLRGLAV
jgi:hypothetical protein